MDKSAASCPKQYCFAMGVSRNIITKYLSALSLFIQWLQRVMAPYYPGRLSFFPYGVSIMCFALYVLSWRGHGYGLGDAISYTKKHCLHLFCITL